MRTPAALSVLAVERRDAQLVDIEEAILHLDVDVVRDRLANAGEHLPRKARVGIIKDRTLVGEGPDVVEVDASKAHAAANEAAEILVAKVQHTVKHEAEDVGLTVNPANARRAGPLAREGHTGGAGDLIHVSMLVAALGLDAETAEVVADEQSGVVILLIINSEGIIDRAEIDVHVFHDHRAEFATDVPGAIARKCRRSEHGG